MLRIALGKCRLKLQWDTTTHPLRWLKFRRVTIPSIGEDVEQLESSYIVEGNAKMTTTLKSSLALPYKHTVYKQTLTWEN